MLRRVLVTGTSGRLGGAVARLLASIGVEVVGLDRVQPPLLDGVHHLAGDVTDPEAVARALDGFGKGDGVVHCAAIPSPELDEPEAIFGTNTAGTFTVLDHAGRRGVRRAVTASSMSIYGHAWSRGHTKYSALPVTEDTPLAIADPYALSKLADEHTASYAFRRHAMTVTALRFPYIRETDGLVAWARHLANDPAEGAAELWAYLHTDDAAQACVQALTGSPEGAHVALATAPESLAADATQTLLRRYYPSVGIEIPGFAVPIRTDRARELFGFRVQYTRETIISEGAAHS